MPGLPLRFSRDQLIFFRKPVPRADRRLRVGAANALHSKLEPVLIEPHELTRDFVVPTPLE
jgi:hypothetical protein